jgi:type IV pilus assembly protein PilP
MRIILLLILIFNFANAQEPQPNGSEAVQNSPPVLPANEQSSDQQQMQPGKVNYGTPATEFVWDPNGKRDPFRPYKAPRILRPDSDTQVDPLLTLELANVKVVAVLWNTENPRAIIQAGGEARYTIFRNTKIGTNSGFVAEIREGEVVVIETFDDGFGNVIKEPKILTMKKNFPLGQQDSVGNLKDTGSQNDD